jgi:hypothetical protein
LLVKQNVHQTDIYIERYLPSTTLNMIREAFNGVLSEYNDNKLFLENVSKRFKEMKEYIELWDAYDKRKKSVMEYRLTLDKKGYHIPDIEVPVTLEHSDEGEGEDYATSDSESF